LEHQIPISPLPSKRHSFSRRRFFYTFLFSREEEYERLDLSEAAWEERKKDPAAPCKLGKNDSLKNLTELLAYGQNI
jgi:hypothetical protein